MDDRLDAMIVAQYAQQAAFLNRTIFDEAERAQIGVDLALGVIEEAREYLDLLDRNALLPRSQQLADRRSARKYQIIDILKYALALAHLDDLTSAELYACFVEKTDIVRLRHQEEVRGLKVASFDIDGVLCDLRGAGFSHDDPEAAKAEFFDNGHVDRCEALPYARSTLAALRSYGWGIILVTTRKKHRHPILEGQTYAWLRFNEIPFDRVVFASDKADALLSSNLPVRFHVEDSAKHAIDVASAGIPVFYVGSAPIEHGDIIPIRDLGVLLDWITDTGLRSRE